MGKDRMMEIKKHALASNNANRFFSIGWMYMRGEGVGTDYKEALYWLEKAAAMQYPQAWYNLGLMNEQGLGVHVNRIQAYRYFMMAEKAGDGMGEDARKRLEKELTAQELDVATSSDKLE